MRCDTLAGGRFGGRGRGDCSDGAGGIGRGRARRDELVFNLLMLSGVVPHNREILIINARFLHYKTVIIL